MPLPPIAGVQAVEPVTVHFGALEICRPGSCHSAFDSGCPRAPTRLSRYLTFEYVTPALIMRSRIGCVNASTSTPVSLTPARVLPVQAPVRGSLSLSAPFRFSLQLLMFSTMKLRPLNVFSWKFLNSWRNTATLRSIQPPLYLAPTSIASLVSGRNCRSEPEARIPAQPGCVVVTQTDPLPDSGGVPCGLAERNSADRSRLNPPAL